MRFYNNIGLESIEPMTYRRALEHSSIKRRDHCATTFWVNDFIIVIILVWNGQIQSHRCSQIPWRISQINVIETNRKQKNEIVNQCYMLCALRILVATTILSQWSIIKIFIFISLFLSIIFSFNIFIAEQRLCSTVCGSFSFIRFVVEPIGIN